MTILEWCKKIKIWGISKGWDFTEKDIPEKLMLVVTELSEAMEEYRKEISSEAGFIQRIYIVGDKPEGFSVELADAVIRIFHIAGKFDIDLEDVIRMKMAYNDSRPFRHGNKRA